MSVDFFEEQEYLEHGKRFSPQRILWVEMGYEISSTRVGEFYFLLWKNPNTNEMLLKGIQLFSAPWFAKFVPDLRGLSFVDCLLKLVGTSNRLGVVKFPLYQVRSFTIASVSEWNLKCEKALSGIFPDSEVEALTDYCAEIFFSLNGELPGRRIFTVQALEELVQENADSLSVPLALREDFSTDEVDEKLTIGDYDPEELLKSAPKVDVAKFSEALDLLGSANIIFCTGNNVQLNSDFVDVRGADEVFQAWTSSTQNSKEDT